MKDLLEDCVCSHFCVVFLSSMLNGLRKWGIENFLVLAQFVMQYFNLSVAVKFWFPAMCVSNGKNA